MHVRKAGWGWLVHLTHHATHFEQGQALFGQASKPEAWPESQRVFLAEFRLGMPSFGGCRVQVSNQNLQGFELILSLQGHPRSPALWFRLTEHDSLHAHPTATCGCSGLARYADPKDVLQVPLLIYTEYQWAGWHFLTWPTLREHFYSLTGWTACSNKWYDVINAKQWALVSRQTSGLCSAFLTWFPHLGFIPDDHCVTSFALAIHCSRELPGR